MPPGLAVEALRRAFRRWGLPERIRVDNGYPWGSRGDLPTELGLWLLGLGVEPVHNRPRRPQDNGAVERSQEIGQRWAEPAACRDAAELQGRLDEMDAHQRCGFPDAARSRMALFPGLAHSGRDYRAAEESATWDAARMRARLAEYMVVRRINARGLISVYGRNHYVGRRHSGGDAYVHLDAESGDWLFELAAGPVLGRAPAGLTREAILEFRVTYRHPCHGKPDVASSGKT